MQTTVPNRPGVNSAKPWYKHRWPWLLMLGPGVVVMAAVYSGWIAFSQQDALVVGDYYRQGKAINQDLRRDQVAARLKLSLDAKYDAAEGRLIGTIYSSGKPFTAAIQIRLIHSTQPEKDINLDAQSDSLGNFALVLPMLERARWQVLVQDKGGEWRLSGAWAWPQQQRIEIHADMAPLD